VPLRSICHTLSSHLMSVTTHLRPRNPFHTDASDEIESIRTNDRLSGALREGEDVDDPMSGSFVKVFRDEEGESLK
jgi:hypothetical protein